MLNAYPDEQAAADRSALRLRSILPVAIAVVVAAVLLFVFAPSSVVAIRLDLLATLTLMMFGSVIITLGLRRQFDPRQTIMEGDQLSKQIDQVAKATATELAKRFARGVTPQTDLFLDPDKGQIMHGGMRHVLFRIGTIQEILRMSVDRSKYTLEEINDRLKKTGEKMGGGFGREFVDHLRKEQLAVYQPNLDEMIDQWCDFDVSGGWGKWHNTRLGDGFEGRIDIKNNYLTAQGDPPALEDQSLCMLLVGYIAGVLQVFVTTANPGTEWEITVREEGDCGIMSGGKNPCNFHFDLKLLS